MHAALRRLWITAKAILAVGLLATGSLYSANVVDRNGLNPFSAALAEPAVTGSIKPGRAR
ncbi:hypothetical protein [Methylobacterium flocculans]|uniref:hypothetical protein n=1 Tax=Methylobacterium flocculans TaxID=2984843 RepID=UPI0021F35342|nr:hypothetical protein [Methylobacterium sp. FF17]